MLVFLNIKLPRAQLINGVNRTVFWSVTEGEQGKSFYKGARRNALIKEDNRTQSSKKYLHSFSRINSGH